MRQSVDELMSTSSAWDPSKLGTLLARDPVWVYDNWAAYAEGVTGLPDTPLTEELAMDQLEHILRLKPLGVHFDYYLMNAFWFDPQGGYRRWHKSHWPDGPDRWLARCLDNGIKPGLWFGSNSLWKINPAPQWRDSIAHADTRAFPFDSMSMCEGGFLPDFMQVLQYWYDRGIRLFEMDAANFNAATPQTHQSRPREEIRERNASTFREALQAFRRKNPDAMLVAFNDFGGDITSTASPFPFRKPVDLRWLEVFDTLYSGDVRVSDVPQASFWRSVDLYNDHMVRRYEQSGVPLERIDPFFTLSKTWFGYGRAKKAWKSALLLTAARGSWKQTVYGGLDLLSDEDASWFAKVQQAYRPLLAMGRTKTFGGIPGEGEPYGLASFSSEGALYTVVNPAQHLRTVALPRLSAEQVPPRNGRLLFRDAGFMPVLDDQGVTLGPGQMAVAGFGRYAHSEYDWGVEADVVIPGTIEPVAATFETVASNVIEATLTAPSKGDLRVLFQQRCADGAVMKDKNMDARALHIEARQEDESLPVDCDQPATGFGGISWWAGEIRRKTFAAGKSLTLRCSVKATEPATLTGQVYVVEY